MPFTFSHPAVVLPFKYLPGKWRSMTGLIIGSMAPDFEKFIRMSAYDAFSHTWKSIFYFNLPISLVAAFVFHLIVRDVLIDHAPAFIQKRLIKLKGYDWLSYFRSHYVVIVLSIIVGTVSHIGWDAFTHRDGRFVQLIPVLQDSIALGETEMSVFHFLQQGFSVLGLLVVVYAFFRLQEQPLPAERYKANRKLRFWISFTLVALAISILRYVFGHHLSYFTNFIVVSIAASLLSLVITSFLFKKYRHSYSVQ